MTFDISGIVLISLVMLFVKAAMYSIDAILEVVHR